METSYTSNFRLIRLLGSELVPSDCEVTAHLQMNDTADDNLQENILKSIQLWFDGFLENSVAYCPTTDIDTTMIEKISNNIILTADEPNDYHLCVLLHSKLNAMGRGAVTVTKTEFSSDAGQGFKCSFSSNVDDWLPSNQEWMGDKTFFDKPWWARSDGSTFDVPYEDGDDINSFREVVAIDLVSMVSGNTDDEKPQQAEIIKPAFKLKLIKDDD